MRNTINAVMTPSGTEDIAVASTATVYTQSFPIFDVDEKFGVKIKAGGAGTKDVLVELEESDVRPATEGSADSDYTEPDGMADVANLVDTDLHITEVMPVLKMYARFKLTGQGSNAATTTVTIGVSR